jgi:small-conductance mechanosensitive channel
VAEPDGRLCSRLKSPIHSLGYDVLPSTLSPSIVSGMYLRPAMDDEMMNGMASLSSNLRSFILVLITIALIAYVANLVFGTIISGQTNLLGLQFTLRQTTQVCVTLVAGGLVMALIRRSSKHIRESTGPYAASVFSYVLVVLNFFVILLAVLDIFDVPASSLVLGGGFGAIIIGLAVSTLFGNIFSGALMLIAKPVVVGDDVLINNIPGRIETISTVFTRIQNESGTETIVPNTAIVSGMVTLTKVPPISETTSGLPFTVGERVYTSYVGGEGTVKGIGSLYTTVLLDGGRQVRIPNSGIMTGSIHIALVNSNPEPELKLSLKIDWDAEKTIKAMEVEAAGAPDVFKSPLQVLYVSLDGTMVELELSCKVEASRKAEAKSRLVRVAYLAKKSPL